MMARVAIEQNDDNKDGTLSKEEFKPWAVNII
jgi:hypothetical protein